MTSDPNLVLDRVQTAKVGDTIRFKKPARYPGPVLRDEITLTLSPAWLRFMEFCKKLGHGEIENLKIHEGVPVLAERVIEKTKFA